MPSLSYSLLAFLSFSLLLLGGLDEKSLGYKALKTFQLFLS